MTPSRPSQEREEQPLAEHQPPARHPEQPAQQTFIPRMRPIHFTVKPVIERTYIEGYPSQEQQPPGRDTGPIIIPVPQPEIVVVQQPPMQEQRYEPPRVLPWPEKVRNEPAPRTRHGPPTVDPVRQSPVDVVPDTGRSEVLPIPEVAPIRKKHLPHPEEKSSSQGKPEVKASELPEVPEAKKPEEKPSGSTTKKLKVYNGEGGRIHTGKQIEEILDWYLQTGQLPDYVTDRQRYSYRHHRSLLERRHLLEQQGITIVVHEINRQP